jgi:hypothetical protein
MQLRAMLQGCRLQGRCRGSISTAGIRRRSTPSSGVGIPQTQPQPQPQLQLQPGANPDDGKWHKPDKKMAEDLRSSEQQEVDDEVSSFEELKVQKQLVKRGKIEVPENPMFMTEARRRRQWRKEESTPVVKEKRNFSLFPRHHRNEPHAAAANQ